MPAFFIMKKILIIILSLWAVVAGAQTKGYFRYDSTQFEKIGGSNELIILNGTRSVTGGVLTNIGNGRTRFVATSAGWGLTGNAGTTAGTNFIGTTDAQDFVIKTNGNEIGRFSGDGLYKVSFGQSSIASGSFSTAIGRNTISSGAFSTSMGRLTIASGISSSATGNLTQAIATSSTTMGLGTIAKSFSGTAIGSFNDTSNVADPTSFSLTNRVFAIGVGTTALARANAMTVLFNGKTTLNKYGVGTFTGTPATYPAFDATGNIIESATPYGGGGISGLTTNYVTKATSATTIGNSQIFDDGTKVGIGTATPVLPLDVVGYINSSVGLAIGGSAKLIDGGFYSNPTAFNVYKNDGSAVNFYVANSTGNVGIGTTTPAASALLDVTSTSKGILIPRMTTAQRNAIASPATSLLVFDVSLGSYYYWTGAAWMAFNTGGTPTLQQTLTAGSTLTGDNTVDGGGNNLLFNNNYSFASVSTSESSLINNGASVESRLSLTSLISGLRSRKYGTGAPVSQIEVYADSIKISPQEGRFTIDTLNNEASQNTLMGWTSTAGANRGKVGYITLGSGLSLASGVLSTSTAYVAKTANYTATISDNVINCTANTFTITLPTAVGIAGRMYVIKNTGLGTITIDADAAELIDGSLTKTMSVQYESYTITSTGAGWIIL